jgi:hypothetical protein
VKALHAIFCIIFIVILGSSLAAGQEAVDYIQNLPSGKINWTQGFIEAAGSEGPPPHYKDRALAATDVARQQAQNKLYDILKSVRIDSTQTVEDIINTDEQMDKRLKTIINNSKVVDQKLNHDGSAQIFLQLEMHGALAQLLLPPYIKQIERVKSVQKPNPEVHKTKNSAHTGLLIDATGLKIQSVIAPIIFNESGQEIYGGAFASREFAVKRGMMIYVLKNDSAFVSQRIQGNPIKIKALKAKGPENCNLVISDGDASIILSASEHLAFLKQCRVVMLIDSPETQNP